MTYQERLAQYYAEYDGLPFVPNEEPDEGSVAEFRRYIIGLCVKFVVSEANQGNARAAGIVANKLRHYADLLDDLHSTSVPGLMELLR